MDKNNENKDNKEKESRLGSVGGQAVIEGVMMKAKNDIAIAVRRENGEIVKKTKPYKSIKDRHKILSIPIIRGFVNFIEMLSLAMSTMTESAEMLGLEEITDKAADITDSLFDKFDKKKKDDIDSSDSSNNSDRKGNAEEATETTEIKDEKQNGEKSMKELKNEMDLGKMTVIASIIGTILGLALSFALFFFLPTFIGNRIKSATGMEKGWFISIVEGVTRLAIFVVYILLVSLLKDIRRTFQYHGAEHMSVFCYEFGEDLTVENVKKYSRFHPRCGTSFLIVMMIVGVIISSIIPASLGMWQRLLVKLMIFPFVIGIGYEFIKYAGKRSSNIIVKIVSAPGLWIQRLTTKRPDDQMLEVAVASLRLALKIDAEEADGKETGGSPESGESAETEILN